MIENVKVPLLPESVTDAVLSKWHKQAGDVVVEGEIIAELETDKIMLEVPAVASGCLVDILKPVGSQVKTDEILCTMDLSQVSATEVTSPAAPTVVETPDSISAIDQIRQAKSEVSKGPHVRKVLRESDIDEREVVQDKPGRITPEDIIRHEASQSTQLREQEDGSERLSRSVPMTRLRKTIATRLLASQAETASVTTFNEVDLSRIIHLRAKYRDEFKEKYAVKLGFMSFFTRACCLALHAYPEVNAAVDGDQIIYHDYCDIGIAVSTEKGLVVPIIRDAQTLGMADIEKQILLYSQQAQQNKLTLESLTGGTFSITNGGVFGSMLSTPILNTPQSAILGMHNIVKRAVVVDNSIEIRPMMYVALTYDHRIIDGSHAVRFLVMVKDLLEDPDRLLLQI